MPIGKISFQGVKTEFEPIPNGEYTCSFVSWKEGITGPNSKNPGEPKMDLSFAVTGDVEGEEEFKGRRLFRTVTFSPESLWAFKRTMANLGSTADWEDPEGIDVDAICREVKDNRCICKVSVEDAPPDPVTGEVKKQNRLLDVLPTDATRLALAEQGRNIEDVTAPEGGRRGRH